MSLKQKIDSDYKKGQEVEEMFFDIFFKLGGFNLKKSSPDQDRKEGWDYEITHISYNNKYPNLIGKKIDVKGIKGLEYNLIEITAYDINNKGKLGWGLRGLADYVALERHETYGNDFVLIEKSKLKKFLLHKVPLLKKLYFDSLRISKDDREKFEKNYHDHIMRNLGEFNLVSTIDDSLYDKIYARRNDLMTRIKNSDLERMCEYKISKNILKND